MKVRVKRSGGFANIARTFTIDSQTLDETGAQDLERVVEALRSDSAERAQRPDAYRYLVEVDNEEFVICESWITEALTRLAKK